MKKIEAIFLNLTIYITVSSFVRSAEMSLPSAFVPYAGALRVLRYSLESRARIAAATGVFDATVAVGNPFAVDHTIDIASAFAAAATGFNSSSTPINPKLKKTKLKPVSKKLVVKHRGIG